MVAREVTEGLKFLHSKGITHGQVTPSQVLLSRSGRAKLDIAVKPHMGGKSSHQSGFEQFGKRSDLSPEEDVFDLGTTLLVCAIGGIEWMDLYSPSTDQTCCLYHSLMRAKIAPMLTRITPAFQSFLCACLQFNQKRRSRASDLLTHDWLLQTNSDPGIKVSFRELLNVSFQWVAPSEYQIAAERQLDRICENLRMVLVGSKPNIGTREQVTELAMDLGLGEDNVRQRLTSVYRFS
jgi:serine/threonine protein kinase